MRIDPWLYYCDLTGILLVFYITWKWFSTVDTAGRGNWWSTQAQRPQWGVWLKPHRGREVHLKKNLPYFLKTFEVIIFIMIGNYNSSHPGLNAKYEIDIISHMRRSVPSSVHTPCTTHHLWERTAAWTARTHETSTNYELAQPETRQSMAYS